MSNSYHPDCLCQQRDLNQDDLTRMHNEGKYSEINEAFEAGRFKLDNNEK